MRLPSKGQVCIALVLIVALSTMVFAFLVRMSTAEERLEEDVALLTRCVTDAHTAWTTSSMRRKQQDCETAVAILAATLFEERTK